MKNTKAAQNYLAKAAQKFLNSIGAEKYLNYDGMAVRYLVDKRTIMRRVALGLLPQPMYFGTKYPRWSLSELDENDRKLASVRLANVAAIAATKAKKAKAAKKKAAKPKSPAPAEKPARKHTAAAEQNEVNF